MACRKNLVDATSPQSDHATQHPDSGVYLVLDGFRESLESGPAFVHACTRTGLAANPSKRKLQPACIPLYFSLGVVLANIVLSLSQ